MISHSNDILIDLDPDARQADQPARPASVIGALPSEVVVTERAAAALRAYLDANGLAHYRIFFNSELYDVETHLDALGEVAAWEPVAPMVHSGEIIHCVTHEDESGEGKLWESGFLRLGRSEVAMGRWYWAGREGYNYPRSLWLFAAPSAEHYARLRERIVELRRQRGDSIWQVIHGSTRDDSNSPRDAAPIDDVILSPTLRARLETDIIGFFRDEVAALYRALKVPYRRGMLMHGPPGNGKTSLIRYVGARLLHVPALLLRPAAKFDTDDLEAVLHQWREQAPAILVIEDLDWLVRHINVSTLLNLLDGVDSNAGAGGLLLIATTNNPHELDPAINNRPGRFDVVIEIDRPDYDMRLELLRRKLPDAGETTLDAVAEATDGLSFAQVMEVLRLSGFAAIAAGRSQRIERDLLDAAQTVSATNDDARRGFPSKPDAPFGLARR